MVKTRAYAVAQLPAREFLVRAVVGCLQRALALKGDAEMMAPVKQELCKQE